jgi:hypothetical protein
MNLLSKEYIEVIEKAILSNKLVPYGLDQPNISSKYYENAEIEWNFIKNADINSYSEFAFNACGIISYGFYKANNRRIYIIESFLNEIIYVYIASKNIDCLKDIITDKGSTDQRYI